VLFIIIIIIIIIIITGSEISSVKDGKYLAKRRKQRSELKKKSVLFLCTVVAPDLLFHFPPFTAASNNVKTKEINGS
jgi:hypothetical protein